MIIFLVALCLLGLWVLITLFDVNQEAEKIIEERKTFKTTKGGVKPMINWTNLAIRALILLIALIAVFFFVFKATNMIDVSDKIDKEKIIEEKIDKEKIEADDPEKEEKKERAEEKVNAEKKVDFGESGAKMLKKLFD